MKIKSCFQLLVVALMSLSTSCTKHAFEVEPETDNDTRFVIKPRIYISDPWLSMTRIGDTDPLFMCYLFNENGNAIFNRGAAISSDMNITFRDVNAPGNYAIYCVTGWFISEYPHTTGDDGINTDGVTLNTELSMFSPKDICLGSQTDIFVSPSQLEYDVVINVEHIMAKASFLIENVPNDTYINNITVTLPNQANKFKFDGTLIGNTQSQTLTLIKDLEANDDGTYNWRVEETIVYPYAQANENMPIHITVTNSNGSHTFETTTSTCCSKGMRVAYKTNWNTIIYHQNTHININPWTNVVVDGSFDLGGVDTETE